ncbi:MAG: hypothetical protein ABSE59_03995 [Opitutaceae bacterium]|jgi:hypothetical protein
MSATLTSSQRRQLWLLTLGAVALFVVVRRLPTGTNIPHYDYVPAGQSIVQFCDPGNPQFLPATQVQSPVTMTLATAGPATAGETVQAVLTLRTYSNKPLGPDDLATAHAKKLHLLIIDPTLTDYQHVHPVPAGAPGAWAFSFKPRAGGNYRFFADFVPVVTGLGLYAWADLPVAGLPEKEVERDVPGLRSFSDGGSASSERGGDAALHQPWVCERDGYRFTITPGAWPIRANRLVDLKFAVERIGGGRVPLEVIMNAFAHLVAFDDQRSGFAHMHPQEYDITKPPDAVHPVLTFKLVLPRAGRYVIWSQVQIASREIFAPFWFDVEE